MTYPFVAARWFSPGAIVDVRALVIHFAEGGGTVSYLRDPRNSAGEPIDVSAHFVIEYDGTIVQMVRDADADHCQHISYGSWGWPGDLTRANGVAVLGKDVMDQADPTRVNRYVQAVELEGKRADGPTDRQVDALRALVAERRTRFPSIRGLLGHGDVQDKPCPGARIPWELLGGHGLLEDPMIDIDVTDPAPLVVDLPAGIKILNLDGSQRIAQLSASRTGVASPFATTSDGGGTALRAIVYSRPDPDPDLLLAVYANAVQNARPPDAPAVKAAVNAALDHVSGAVDSVDAAIAEARIR